MDGFGIGIGNTGHIGNINNITNYTIGSNIVPDTTKSDLYL